MTMWIEGVGKAAPKPVRWRIYPADVRDLQQLAKEREGFHDYASSPDQWRSGLVSNATYAGLAAEFSVAALLSKRVPISPPLQIDRKQRCCGDSGYDLAVLGIKLQVKGRFAEHDTSLLRRQKPDGKILPMLWDACVVATLGELCAQQGQHVAIDGWFSRDESTEFSEFAPARRGQHMNLEFPAESLHPVSELINHLKARLLK